jgi:hypothetical protein
MLAMGMRRLMVAGGRGCSAATAGPRWDRRPFLCRGVVTGQRVRERGAQAERSHHRADGGPALDPPGPGEQPVAVAGDVVRGQRH